MIFNNNNVSEIIEFTRLYLALFYTFVAIFYTTRIVLMKKHTTRELVFPGERFGSTWWNHMLFRLFRVAIWMVCLFRFIIPSFDNYLGFIPIFQSFGVILLGNFLLTIGFIFTITIHCSLGKKWRSGIDPEGPIQLISHSFYKYSRNPMFLSIAVSQIGFFIALPSIFSLVCLLIGLYTLNRQAKSEEQHLSRVLPKEYKHYCSRVKRWF